MSSDPVDSLHLSTSLVDDPVCISNPIGGSARLSVICRGLRISILSVEFLCSAYVLDFRRYGLIFGKDWLSRYGAILDFELRVVRLMTRLGNTLEISCNPMDLVAFCYVILSPWTHLLILYSP